MTLNAGVRYDRYRGWLPEQEQIGATSARSACRRRRSPSAISSPGTRSRRASASSIDLAGDGKTVVKANYGLYWHNPGVGVSRDANPNTANKSRDLRPGPTQRRPPLSDRVRKAARSTASRSQGAIGLDPNITAPCTHEASAWVERQLTDTMGVRVGFVYKTEDDLFAPINYQPLRGPRQAYTAAVHVHRHRRRRRRGTADDRTLTDAAASRRAERRTFPTTTVVDEPPIIRALQDDRGVDEQALREPLVGARGGSHTCCDDFPNDYPQNPNQPGRRTPTLELQGVGHLRRAVRHPHLAGAAASVGRELRAHDASVPARAGDRRAIFGAHDRLRRAAERDREDNITVFDIRAEKSFTFGALPAPRVSSICSTSTNSHASETITPHDRPSSSSRRRSSRRARPGSAPGSLVSA